MRRMICVGLCVFYGSAAGAQTTELGEISTTLTLPPVIVQGELYTRPLGETAASVRVFDDRELEINRISEFDDVVRGVPNVSPPTTLGPPAIRGLSSSGPSGDGSGGLATNLNTGTLPRAPFIVDGVARITSISDADYRDLWDTESVEIFRGPQTTLRGRNALAGAFVINTKDPTFTPERKVRTGIEVDDFHGIATRNSFVLSGTLFEDVAAGRISFDRRAGKAPMRLVGPRASINPSAELTDDAQLDNELTRIRGKLLLLPPGLDDATVKVTVDAQTGTVAGNRFTVGDQLISGRSVSDRAYPFGRNGGQRVYDTETWTASIDATYDLTDTLSLRSITSATSALTKTNDRQSDFVFFNINEKQYNQDLILEIGDGMSSVDGVVGLSFNQRQQDVDIDNLALPLADNTFTTSKDVSQSQAVFTDLTIGLFDSVDLLAGVRVNRYSSERTQRTFPGSPGFGPFPSPGIVTQDLTETEVLPKIGLGWSITDNHSLMATARKGYNPGGASAVLATGLAYTFDSESVWTYEATYRGVLADGRVTVDATAFFNDFKDPQLFLQTGPGGLAALQIVNGGEGQSYGAEISATARVTEALNVRAGVGLLETEVTKAPTALPAIEGNDFGGDPGTTVSLGADWQPLDGLTLAAKGTYVGEYFSDAINRTTEEAGDYALLDVTASYEHGPVIGRLFVKNATDEEAVTRKLTNSAGPGFFNDLLPPRTVGAELMLSF